MSPAGYVYIATVAIPAAILCVIAVHAHVVNRRRLDALNRHYSEDFR